MLMRFLAALALLLAGAFPALAQSSTGGSIGALTSGSPNLICTTTTGALSSVQCNPTSPVQNQVGSPYTMLPTDGGQTTKIGVSSGTCTLTVPQAGSAGFPARWSGAYVNAGTAGIPCGVANASGSTSIFDGAGGGAGFPLPVNASVVLTSEPGGNWLALVSSPTIGTLWPQVVQFIGGSSAGCNQTSQTVCTATIAATGAGHALAVIAEACQTSGCNAGGSAFTVAVTDGGDTCTLVSGTDSGSTNAVDTQWQVCPNVAAGRTTVTATWSGTVNYPIIYVYELQNVPTSSVTEAGSANFIAGNPITCTSGTTTVANDLLLVGNESAGGTPSLGSPWTQSATGVAIWYQVGASLTTYAGRLSNKYVLLDHGGKAVIKALFAIVVAAWIAFGGAAWAQWAQASPTHCGPDAAPAIAAAYGLTCEIFDPDMTNSAIYDHSLESACARECVNGLAYIAPMRKSQGRNMNLEWSHDEKTIALVSFAPGGWADELIALLASGS